MEINTPEFNEKQFLLGLLSLLNKKYGDESRFIFEHSFDSVDIDIIQYIPELNKIRDNIVIKKYLSEWFREAHSRGYMDSFRNYNYKINPTGLEAARKYKKPIKTFVKEHWKFITTISLSFIGAIVAIIRLTKS